MPDTLNNVPYMSASCGSSRSNRQSREIEVFDTEAEARSYQRQQLERLNTSRQRLGLPPIIR